MSDDQVFQWLLDVDRIWLTQFEGVEPFRSSVQWSKEKDVQAALSQLPSDESTKVLKFYRHTDAKLCLGSCLLKRRAISDFCNVPWADVAIGVDSNRKPCYSPKEATGKKLEFNVSHHGTLVALVGCPGNNVKLGVDVVRMSWEKDYDKVMKEGFESWATTYEMVFSPREMRDISEFIPPNCRDSTEVIKAKLRHFYAFWCLKEAFVKMTGEALMASWLKRLEFRDVDVPECSTEGSWGRICRNVEIYFDDERVEGVLLQIQSFCKEYMIATCASSAVVVEPFKVLSADQLFPSIIQP
ncbi:uncharacterized protein KY384_008992 [Bacidia gigantensis]|uniref:uncharacterized protein n=1 Tax=Bacidia gigantensis TaxID=2732470 RepID=UPI001D0508D3|nr:uncharacterized protein KY384_008992 [Bacidia gigantensis]KAG8525348.1 hypothetical protein KY384_008992 [Bacidia gigantensis]